MRLMKLTTLAALFSATAMATTTVDHNDIDVDHTTIPEPDPRFENFTLPHPRSLLTRRGQDVYGFYECSAPYFKGLCAWTQITPGESKCHNQKYGPLGSFGPDRNVKCHIYSAPDCGTQAGRDHKDGFMWPGTGDCPNTAGLMGTSLAVCPRSWRCEVF